jgi:N-acetylglucosamine-6-phosphate deacetylase
MQGGNAVATLARTHARHGTTALLATTMTAPRDEIEAALRAIAPHIATRPAGGARVLGVHLEGPYLNPERLGAQPDFATPATLAEVRALHTLAPIRLVTIAPELPGHLALIVALRREGFVVQLGHSAARYEDGVAALAAGASGFTHLFNAMSGLSHRAPGLVGAALDPPDAYIGLIADGVHVPPWVLASWISQIGIDRTVAVTDGTAAAGMPPGRYALGGREVVVAADGAAWSPDRSHLVGSTATPTDIQRILGDAVGLTAAEIERLTTINPAQMLGDSP